MRNIVEFIKHRLYSILRTRSCVTAVKYNISLYITPNIMNFKGFYVCNENGISKKTY